MTGPVPGAIGPGTVTTTGAVGVHVTPPSRVSQMETVRGARVPAGAHRYAIWPSPGGTASESLPAAPWAWGAVTGGVCGVKVREPAGGVVGMAGAVAAVAAVAGVAGDVSGEEPCPQAVQSPSNSRPSPTRTPSGPARRVTNRSIAVSLRTRAHYRAHPARTPTRRRASVTYSD